MNMKKISSLLLALVLVLAMAVPAMAAEETTTITINGGASGSEYAAYKLLNATNDGTKYAYTLNEKYTAILQTVTGKTEQADIVAYIAAQDTADETRTFADAVYAKIVEANLAADYTTDNNSFAVAQGYYLIAETKVGNAQDTFSLVMLDTAGDTAVTVDTKESVPSVEKKVEEKNDSTGDSSWGDSADYDVGDTINYTITGTVSNKYANYGSYYYSFGDTMEAGLTYNEDAKVYVVNGNSKVEVTEQFAIATTADGFTATANLKELTGVTIDANTEIVVEYSATLNDKAVSGTAGNKNTVTLKYENDPYVKADGDPTTPEEPKEPGETIPDVNVVFTYDAIVNKVDGAGNALAGAGFTLYKWVEVTAANEDTPAVYDWVAVGSEITGVTTFEFEKLDEGKYKLVETTVPDGYNKADDVVFVIESTLIGENLTALIVKDAEGVTISGTGEDAQFSVTLDEDSSEVTTDIVNNSGTELPETGGMGTTILYVAGGILVLGAVIVLITKKRMAASK